MLQTEAYVLQRLFVNAVDGVFQRPRRTPPVACAFSVWKGDRTRRPSFDTRGPHGISPPPWGRLRRYSGARNPAGTPLTASSLQPAAAATAGGTATRRSGL